MNNKLLSISILIISFCISGEMKAQGTDYSPVFNPVQGLVKMVEKPNRDEICLNGRWKFMPVYDASSPDSFVLPAKFSWETTDIKIPSPWDVNNFTRLGASSTGGDFVTFPSYPEKWKDAKIGWMKKVIQIPSDWKNKTIILHFEGIIGKSKVYVNGKLVAENFDLFLPFQVDITDVANPGETAEILVGVGRPSLFHEPGPSGHRPFVGGSFWGEQVAGIWQDVYLFAYPEVYVNDVYINPDVKNNQLSAKVEIRNTTDKIQKVSVDGLVKKWINLAGRTVQEAPEEKWILGENVELNLGKTTQISIEPNSTIQLDLSSKVDSRLEFWTPDSPNLYGLLVNLNLNGIPADIKYERFGWRQFSIEGTKLLLNGNPIRLMGDAWHFMGVPQMTRRYAWGLFNMYKTSNTNAVRFHAQPYPRFYLDLADEMGICVLDETAIWGSGGGPKADSEKYWERCNDHLKRFILRDRNHASVFGWSISNEVLWMCLWGYSKFPALLDRQVNEMNRWIDIVRELDPSRPWISGDGDFIEERSTNLPTIMGHYGDEETLKWWSSFGLPWGVGEQGMAYYGSPRQVSKANGNRAYECIEGRMEGLGVDCYNLIKKQKELGASYVTTFNLAWYALKPLALGMNDISNSPKPGDGIFFTAPYQEGKPGMQPERLGPYTTTINPGYDPEIPLFDPWYLYYAIKKANANPIQPLNYKTPEYPGNASPLEYIKHVVFIGDDNSQLKKSLEQIGLVIDSKVLSSDNTLVIVDGNDFTSDQKQIKQLKKLTGTNAVIFVMGLIPENVSKINPLLRYEIQMEPRVANSFLKVEDVPVLSNMNHSDLYFTELLHEKGWVMTHGLSGDFVTHGSIIANASPLDWGKWNFNPESVKTAAILRSQRETKGPAAAIVSASTGKGEIIISSLNFNLLIKESEGFVRSLLKNLGANISNTETMQIIAIDVKGNLKKALICGAFNDLGKNNQELLDTSFISDLHNLKPQLGMRAGGKLWNTIASNNEFKFNLKGPEISGSNENGAIYLSFWLYSPRDLINFLLEPDMPALFLNIETQDAFQIILNGKSVHKETNSAGKSIKTERLDIERGWNHFIIKVVHGTGDGPWNAKIRFISDNENFLKEIKSGIVRD